jgi:hypothetical protein
MAKKTKAQKKAKNLKKPKKMQPTRPLTAQEFKP